MQGHGGNHLHHVALALAALGFGLVVCLKIFASFTPPVFGATFSSDYAQELGLQPHQVYQAILDELQPKIIRLSVRWNDVEQTSGSYDFSELDWYMNQALKNKTQIILAVGNKVPRWPECETPDWAQDLSTKDYQAALLAYVRSVVERYSHHPALLRWQVENEELFPFGECPLPDYDRLIDEVSLVRRLDTHHPIQLTVSGEQQVWASEAKLADVVGTSVYRFAWNPLAGFVLNWQSVRWYTLQAMSITPFVHKVVISELQAEPWFPRDPLKYSPEEASALFTPAMLRLHTTFAVRTGIREISFWGVEWWYYMKEHGYPGLWDEAIRLIHSNRWR